MSSNTYELGERVEIIELLPNGLDYLWVVAGYVWAKAERTERTNIFSTKGIGAPTIKFTMRKCRLTRHDAIRKNGLHCFITDIIETGNRRWFEVAAALVEPRICAVTRTVMTVDELKRPIMAAETVMTFPACLTEKYLGCVQDTPMAVTETQYILVTPKVILLDAGEVVEIGSDKYTVLLSHTLNEYRNEYEIIRKAEV